MLTKLKHKVSFFIKESDGKDIISTTTSRVLPQEQVVPCYPPHLRRHSRNLLLVDLRLCVVVGIVNIPDTVRLMYVKG